MSYSYATSSIKASCDSRIPIFCPLLSTFSLTIPFFFFFFPMRQGNCNITRSIFTSYVRPQQLLGVRDVFRYISGWRAWGRPASITRHITRNGAKMARFKLAFCGIRAHTVGGRSAELAGEAAQWWLSSGRDVHASWDRHRSLSPAKSILRTKNKMSGGNKRIEKTQQNMTACSRSIS